MVAGVSVNGINFLWFTHPSGRGGFGGGLESRRIDSVL